MKVVLPIMICAIFVSSMVVTLVYAQTSISKPLVPQFTLRLIGASQVQITIQNQPLTLTMNNESLYYAVRVKGQLENDWTEIYTYNSPDNINLKGTIPPQSNSQYTELTYSAIGFPENTQVDFQVQAIYGVYSTQEPASHDPFVPAYSAFRILADGESGWSTTQTITVITLSPSESTSPVPTEAPKAPLGTTAFPSASPSPTAEVTPSQTVSPSSVVTSNSIQPSSQVGFPTWLYVVTVLMALAIGVLLGIVVMQRKRISQTCLECL